MEAPVASYRLQFCPQFGFAAAAEVVSYLAELGVSHIYASPVWKARKGSSHGYDIVDPTGINPELGGEDGFEKLIAEVKRCRLFWLQDIVPNHMAFDGENAMLMDVLEKGQESSFASFFDIEWDHPYENMRGKVLAPLLGKSYGECLEAGELRLTYVEGDLRVEYWGEKFPLRIEAYAKVFEDNLEVLEERLRTDAMAFTAFLGALEFLKGLANIPVGASRDYQVRHGKLMLWRLYCEHGVIREFMEGTIAAFNGRQDEPRSLDGLDRLLSEQFYRLSFWKVGSEEINYRRFFAVNDLISLLVEDEAVLRHTHGLVFRLLREGKFQGLRIDHLDGLYDPLTYLERLRAEVGDTYIVVEKILAPGEELPSSLPVEGTTGYDYLRSVTQVMCALENRRAFSAIYDRFTGLDASYEELLFNKKLMIIGKYLAGNIDNLAHHLKKISSKDRQGLDITLYGLRRALVEVMASFPVYRTYINGAVCGETDRKYITEAIGTAKKRSPGLYYELAFLEKFLLLNYDASVTDQEKREWTAFGMHFQQFTGPLMAKGFEDTFLYVYNRLLSLNEVGGDPFSFGCSVRAYHEFCENRATRSPLALNATATHDTKWGEDVRARLNVLSEVPREWDAVLKRWSKINRSLKRKIAQGYAPDRNDEYLIYQTLIGAYPFGEMPEDFSTRMQEYLVKAVREAKVHTGWIRPDSDYERACTDFVKALLGGEGRGWVREEFLPFQRRMAHYGVFNSLSQVLLKVTSPGVPDFYQGTELWDFSLVDPDNRRSVDFLTRRELLRGLKEGQERDMLTLMGELFSRREDGRIKLFLISRTLEVRGRMRRVFEKGRYVPLYAEGRYAASVVAYVRVLEGRWALAVAPRLLTAVVGEGEDPLGEAVWGDTRVRLPEGAPRTWREAVSDQLVLTTDDLPVGKALQHFCVALLVNESA